MEHGATTPPNAAPDPAHHPSGEEPETDEWCDEHFDADARVDRDESDHHHDHQDDEPHHHDSSS
jgi:hypothetical protein